MAELDRLLPAWDWRERHELALPVKPEEAVKAFLGAPAAPDRVVRALLRLRGLRMLSTETRIAAIDGDARRAFGRYWRLVGRSRP